ncbi:hypothetical protein ACWGH3_14645 [Streptomyces sp. NPDC054884]|uniref:hypothetical protein n=1 Tax=Streptomyces sp. ME08-AFT2 TaxID=3028683 RepID=UPI0029B2C203|nr:hypothetical protein [Streptomyces sp. ME08-AFT2]MDX3311125.1 hypothetical protein [Streptomyces sp. ME08-AFT2]
MSAWSTREARADDLPKLSRLLAETCDPAGVPPSALLAESIAKSEVVDWDSFDSDAYAALNYGDRIHAEDKQIIRFVVTELKKLRIPFGQMRNAADIGAGPNLYPGLLLTPYMSPGGTLELVDRSAANLHNLREAMDDAGASTVSWTKFEDFLLRLGHRTSLQGLRNVAKVREGSIFELPTGRYDAVLCFFVAESITADRDVFAAGLDSLMKSLKPGGLFITAHMVGSTGYQTGTGNSFPACDLTMPDIEQHYYPYGEYQSIFVSHGVQDAIRPGYQGMAALIGRTHSLRPRTTHR